MGRAGIRGQRAKVRIVILHFCTNMVLYDSLQLVLVAAWRKGEASEAPPTETDFLGLGSCYTQTNSGHPDNQIPSRSLISFRISVIWSAYSSTSLGRFFRSSELNPCVFLSAFSRLNKNSVLLSM